jgi:hypothetical protein
VSDLLGPLDGEARRALFRGYFLAALDEERTARLEEEVLGEHALYEEMDGCADELIRDYLAGALAAEERGRFERHFLASPRRRERVAFLRDLGQAIDRVAPLPVPARSRRAVYLALAAALLLAALLAFLRLRPAAVPQRARQPVRAPSAGAPSGLPAPERLRTTPLPAADIQEVALAGGSAAGPTPVAIAGHVSALRLRVPFAGPASPSYAVVVRDAAGTVRWRSDDVAPASATALEVVVPSAALSEGDYELVAEGEALRGPEGPRVPPTRARFRVIRQP